MTKGAETVDRIVDSMHDIRSITRKKTLIAIEVNLFRLMREAKQQSCFPHHHFITRRCIHSFKTSLWPFNTELYATEELQRRIPSSRAIFINCSW